MVSQNPFELFALWLEDAKQTSLNEPTAMTLATVSEDGMPSARIILLKGFDDRGFCFYTNLTSRKGKELAATQKAALCFYWDELHRQIRVTGNVERVSEKEADDYFASRRRGSQIGAWASKQSTIMQDEHDLPNRVKEIAGQFEGGDIPRPPFWSGFRLIPRDIEFWEEREYRLHRRRFFTKTPAGWQEDILYP